MQCVKESHTPALMVLGTGSHVGKSLLTAALGRILSDDGYRVAPFKAQNMSLNSGATPDGREIGRAQVLQAEACRATPCAEMNPVLIKPASDTASQVILLGKIWGQVTASDYHLRRVEELFPAVLESYRTLAQSNDVIVIEGAGSPAEINLREHDIVNMRMATAVNAACLLVGDIDRGGVFASLLGTLKLLLPKERALVRGYAINKFRGDVNLLLPGIDMVAPRLGIPCTGVVPYLHNLGLDEEDGVAVEERRTASRVSKDAILDHSPSRQLRIVVVAFPHLSNFTDFDPLAAEPSVSLAYVDNPHELATADVAILPGSKQTIDDLDWMRKRGFDRVLFDLHARGGMLAGICGGFQMLGESIEDSLGIESGGTAATRTAMGLLGISTVLGAEKMTRQVRGVPCAGKFTRHDRPFRGYEIHVGETIYANGTSPFSEIRRTGGSESILDGAVSADGRIWGTYVHGLFDDDAFRHAFIDEVRNECGLRPACSRAFVDREREARLDRLASAVRESLNLNLIYSWIGLRRRSTGVTL